MARAVSGAIGGALAMAVTYPLSNASIKLSTESAAELKAHEHENVLLTLIRMAREEGAVSLYAGLESAVLGTMASEGIFYFWFSLARRLRRGGATEGALSPYDQLVSSCQAGVVNVFFTTPIWVINNRYITAQSHENAPSLLGAIRELYREEGLGGFYRGLGPSLLLVSNPIVTYTVYESLKSMYPGHTSSLQRFALAALAKLLATILTYPMLLLKSRMQKARGPRDGAPSDAQGWAGAVERAIAPAIETAAAARTVFETEGIRGFYHGLQAKAIQSVLRNSFLFAFEARVLAFILWLLRKRAPR